MWKRLKKWWSAGHEIDDLDPGVPHGAIVAVPTDGLQYKLMRKQFIWYGPRTAGRMGLVEVSGEKFPTLEAAQKQCAHLHKAPQRMTW